MRTEQTRSLKKIGGNGLAVNKGEGAICNCRVLEGSDAVINNESLGVQSASLRPQAVCFGAFRLFDGVLEHYGNCLKRPLQST